MRCAGVTVLLACVGTESLAHEKEPTTLGKLLEGGAGAQFEPTCARRAIKAVERTCR
jgi:hypothetical protein